MLLGDNPTECMEQLTQLLKYKTYTVEIIEGPYFDKLCIVTSTDIEVKINLETAPEYGWFETAEKDGNCKVSSELLTLLLLQVNGHS